VSTARLADISGTAWLRAAGRSHWAAMHAVRPHGNPAGLWRVGRDIPPQRFCGICGFRELSASPVRAPAAEHEQRHRAAKTAVGPDGAPALLGAFSLTCPRRGRKIAQAAPGWGAQWGFSAGLGGMPFILWSRHWLSASCVRLSGLYAFASHLLKADTVCASVPQREAMLLFPLGTSEQRDQMRALIRENEVDARKPLTWELFILSAAELQPLVGR
jgi:hypothetical protein